jgi:hypothetical protein
MQVAFGPKRCGFKLNNVNFMYIYVMLVAQQPVRAGFSSAELKGVLTH